MADAVDLRPDSIRQKIEGAGEGYARGEAIFRADKKLPELLRDFSLAVLESRQTMAEIGVASLCRDCEQKEGGSCCGKGLEDKYSQTLLLINLLLKVRLPSARHDPRSCFFLEKSGCCLTARHVICVNYLCAKITTNISPEKIALLRKKEGVELDLLFLINERVKHLLLTVSK